MKFMLMSFESSEDFATRTNVEEMESYWEGWGTYFKKMEAAKILANAGNILRSGDDAITVRPENNQSAGSYAKDNNQLSGFWVIDVTDINQAVEWANQAPATVRGAVEIRPVWQ